MREIEERKKAARERFANHVATEVLKNDDFLILDWRDKSGSGEYFVRYILDVDRGELHVTGDLGDCIACWYNRVEPKDMACYVSNDIYYFIGKIKAASDKYSYDWQDIKDDIRGLKERYLEDDEYEEKKAEIEEDFEEIERIFEDITVNEYSTYPTELTDIFEKYTYEWWESGFSDIGRRVDSRVILWGTGFRMAYDYLYNN